MPKNAHNICKCALFKTHQSVYKQEKHSNRTEKKGTSLSLFLFSIKKSILILNYSAVAGVSSAAAGASTAASAFFATVERRVRAAFLVAFSFNMFSL